MEIPPWPVGMLKGGDPTGNVRVDARRDAACRHTYCQVVLVISVQSVSGWLERQKEQNHRRGLRAVSGMTGERVFLPRSQFTRLEFCPDSLLKLVSHFCLGEQESLGPLSKEEGGWKEDKPVIAQDSP